jgi:hypothetical protein
MKLLPVAFINERAQTFFKLMQVGAHVSGLDSVNRR